MSMTETRPIRFVNTDHATVEKMLLDGKTPREISDLLAEPLPNVMGVWSQLRTAGKVEARNFPAAATAASVTPSIPRHTPDQDLARRIAGATDLLVRAADIDDKRIQNALGRARKAMTDLAALITSYESKSAARQRIARLEAELRIAKAELRGDVAGEVPAREGGASRAKYTRAPETPVECRKGCGRICKTASGRFSHERNCTGAA